MPTPPTIFDANCVTVGESPYSGNSEISTWGKTRCAAIIDPSPGTGSFGYSVGSNSLIIDEGFHPDDSYFFRVERWPYTYTWTDPFPTSHTAHAGPHLGFSDIGSPADSYLSIGGYNVPDSTNGDGPNYYRPYDNLLDENDCANFWEGRLVNATYTTDADFCNSDRSTNLSEYGTNIGAIGGFGGYSSVSDMTAF
jgi:hypothetical protein